MGRKEVYLNDLAEKEQQIVSKVQEELIHNQHLPRYSLWLTAMTFNFIFSPSCTYCDTMILVKECSYLDLDVVATPVLFEWEKQMKIYQQNFM